MKHQHGFTMIEILIAMAILTSTVYVLSDLHIRSMFKLMRDREQLLKFFVVKNSVVEQLPLIKKKFKAEMRVSKDGGMTLLTDLVEQDKKSQLKDILGKKLVLIKSVGSWKDGPFTRSLEFFSIAQREEEPANAKKK